ncbi:MAG: hypothetical protein R3292_03010 [Alcanivorax sp.]|nr:hypothetical protein [Alcanivorax sp.]
MATTPLTSRPVQGETFLAYIIHFPLCNEYLAAGTGNATARLAANAQHPGWARRFADLPSACRMAARLADRTEVLALCDRDGFYAIRPRQEQGLRHGNQAGARETGIRE